MTETVRQRAIAAGIAQRTSYPHGTGRILARKRAALSAPTPPETDESNTEGAMST